jgi:hypothetical protein
MAVRLLGYPADAANISLGDAPNVKKLFGKTREEIEKQLAGKSRAELLDLIHSLVTVEQLLKPSEIAARSCLNKRAVLRDIRDGKFGDYYCRAENSIAVPASGVNKWRNNFRVPARPKQEHKPDLGGFIPV